MAKTIEVLSFTRTGKQSFKATGTINEKKFTAKTILWGPKDKKTPIFKIQESGEDGAVGLQKMKTSKFDRGERIAVARFLQIKRVELEAAQVEEAVKMAS